MICIRALFSVCLAFFFVKLQLELVRATREPSRRRHRRHPSRRSLAQIDRLRAGDRYSWSSGEAAEEDSSGVAAGCGVEDSTHSSRIFLHSTNIYGMFSCSPMLL